MGNVGDTFCNGCKNRVCGGGDGTSMGESDLTNKQNQPITNINNPFLFNNNKTTTLLNEPKVNNENTESIINNNFNKGDNSFVTTLNSRLPPDEEQKKSQLYSKNSNNKNNNINNNYTNNNYNYNYDINNNNNNSLNNSMETNKFDNEQIKEISARKITRLFRKFLNAKKISHQKLCKEFSQIPSSEYIIGLNIQELTVNLAPEENCLYLGTKFNEKKDGLGLEIFNNVNAKYFGIFRNGKRIAMGKYTISNNFCEYTYTGCVQGIYALGYGIFNDKKKFKNYEGEWENSMKKGYGIEKYRDNSEFKGCFLNGKRDGIGLYNWSDGSLYEGEWKDNKFNGYGIYKFQDGSQYSGEWKKGKLHGFGEYISPNKKKYFGYFQKDQRTGFGIEIWYQEKKAFIGFWKNGIMNGYGKLIHNDKKKYGIWKEGEFVKKFKKKEFYKKINEEKNGFFNYFQLDDYKAIVNLINGNIEEEYY